MNSESDGHDKVRSDLRKIQEMQDLRERFASNFERDPKIEIFCVQFGCSLFYKTVKA